MERGEPQRRTARADIQGLRALAVLLVVAYHARLGLSGGFTGVDVFFVISGFVITSTLRRELVSTGSLSLPRFYARRIRRLLPALALVVSVVSLIGVLASPIAGQRVGAGTGLAASFFVANFYAYRQAADYFGVSAALNPLLHTWTLGVEEQFYVFFPALLVVAWRVARRRPRRGGGIAAGAVLVVSATSFFLSLEFSRGRFPGIATWPQQFAFYSSPTRAWEFGVGALLSLVALRLERIPRAAAWLLGLAGLGAIALGAVLISSGTPFPGLAALLPVGGTAALIAAGTASSQGAPSLLGARPLVWIGDRSYSWYLWHWPFVVFATALLPGTRGSGVGGACLSIVPASLAFRFVENPLRVGIPLRTRAVAGVAVTCIVVQTAACIGLWEANRLVVSTASGQAWAASQVLPADVTRGCDTGIPFGRQSPPQCTWRVPNARGTIVLIGDSNAGQFTGPVTRAANLSTFDATVVTLSACPFIQVRLAGRPGAATCLTFVTRSVRDLVAARPALVIVANRTDDYVEDPAIGVGGISKGPITRERMAKAVVVQQGLENEFRQLTRAGIPVVLVHPIPALPSRDVGNCAVIRLLNHSCDVSLSRSTVDKRRTLSVRAESRAAAAVPGVHTLDFINRFCDPWRCFAARGDVITYRDDEHLSTVGALQLTAAFRAAIEANASARRQLTGAVRGTRSGSRTAVGRGAGSGSR